MNNYISYCGLNCESCVARIATINNDNELRKKVAEEWSKLNGVKISCEMINCVGCRIPGVKYMYCDSLCEIRKCATLKEFETCGSCDEIKSCKKIDEIIRYNPDALERLESIDNK